MPNPTPYQQQPAAPQPPTYQAPKQKSSHLWFYLFLLVLVLFFAAAGFGGWAFTSRQDYKNNVDQKITEAISVANEELSATKDAEFAEQEKNPLESYKGPAAFGSVSINYPKIWSAYVEESARSNSPLSGYFHPGFVPGTASDVALALRIEVVESDYAVELKKFENGVKNGEVKVSPYTAPNVADTVGARIDGEILRDKKGSMVLLPLRDKTLKIWTEAEEFRKDFNGIILANLTFTP